MEQQTPKTKICYKCKEEINYGATKCPKCQSDLRSWFAKHKIITIILGFILFVSIITAISNETSNTNQMNSSNSSTQDIDKKFNYKARACAKNYIKTKLNSNNDPKFPGSYGIAQYLGNMTFKVDSSVDVKNAFGVYITSNYSCNVIVGDKENDFFDCVSECKTLD